MILSAIREMTKYHCGRNSGLWTLGCVTWARAQKALQRAKVGFDRGNKSFYGWDSKMCLKNKTKQKKRLTQPLKRTWFFYYYRCQFLLTLRPGGGRGVARSGAGCRKTFETQISRQEMTFISPLDLSETAAGPSGLRPPALTPPWRVKRKILRFRPTGFAKTLPPRLLQEVHFGTCECLMDSVAGRPPGDCTACSRHTWRLTDGREGSTCAGSAWEKPPPPTWHCHQRWQKSSVKVQILL